MAFLLGKDQLVFSFVLSIPIMVATSAFSETASALARKEMDRREAAVQEAQMLLVKGDEAYQTGKYEEAVAAYSGALERFPESAITNDLRAATIDRYAQASVELAKQLSKKGDVQGAKAIVDKVLADEVAPGHSLAKTYRAYLDDPIRTNPALTKEHAADVDVVRRTLYRAQGAFDLGKYDQAREYYNEVIRIDPYNKAARRGLERVAAEKTSYYKSAYDHSRAKMLAEVDGAWELSLDPGVVTPDPLDDFPTRADGGLISLSNKLSRIVVPEFSIEDGTLLEAVDLLRLRASESDLLSLDPDQKGINITVNLGDSTQSPAKEILAKTFDLRVSNVPVETILRYITDLTGTRFRPDDFAVSITPAGSYTEELISRTYRIPPDFLSSITSGSNESAEPEDIFNTAPSNSGLLARRKGVQEALADQGVLFPEGTSASLNATTNTLRVVNTLANQDIIQQIIDSIAQTEPVSVAVRVTMIKVEESVLEELSFDWMLSEFGVTSNSVFGNGGTTGSGSPITDMPAPPVASASTNPITAGNRSGTDAILPNSIDAILGASSVSGSRVRNRAPGVLAVNGVFSDGTVQMLMRGLEQSKGTDLMARPSVTTRSGQAASIQLIDEFIYPSEYEPPELPNSVGTAGGSGGFPVTPATPTAFEKRDVGISLEVLPVADANRRYVDVTLNPSVTNFAGFVNYGTPITSVTEDILGGPRSVEITPNAILMPVFNVRRTNSNVVVADGATIVIAGLLSEEISNVNDKTPILGDIPLVGRLFRSDARKHISTAVLFLVNVELLDPTGRPYRDR
ncbi:MAG: Amuc_1098 family type IV pilus outer membrane protein [Akkermansiaceae bacterium]